MASIIYGSSKKTKHICLAVSESFWFIMSRSWKGC
ncbi:hypothetical protein LEMLEM_LOCUS16888 [Lemmus lemmus]